MFNIVLVEPEIPGNTGNIARTCVVTGSRLHLVEPMGFSIDEKQVRRAGLDYWDKLDLTVYRDLDTFREENKCKARSGIFQQKPGKCSLRRISKTAISSYSERSAQVFPNIWCTEIRSMQ